MNKLDEQIRDSYKIFFDEEGIFHIEIIAKLYDTELSIIQATQIKDRVLEVVKENPGKKFLVLLDITRGEESKLANIKVRKIYLDLLKKAKTSVLKFAVCGRKMISKIILNSFFMFVDKKYAWFINREKAMEWLKEE